MQTTLPCFTVASPRSGSGASVVFVAGVEPSKAPRGQTKVARVKAECAARRAPACKVVEGKRGAFGHRVEVETPKVGGLGERGCVGVQASALCPGVSALTFRSSGTPAGKPAVAP